LNSSLARIAASSAWRDAIWDWSDATASRSADVERTQPRARLTDSMIFASDWLRMLRRFRICEIFCRVLSVSRFISEIRRSMSSDTLIVDGTGSASDELERPLVASFVRRDIGCDPTHSDTEFDRVPMSN
jgi:hypothetical protein